MDYDQWKPLGRGDPLKNDPTYDYVPPKLDRVHYWVDTTPRKPDPDPQKTEILVLGVSSKKSSTGASNSRTDYDTLLKFLDGTKLGNVKNAVFPRQRPPHYSVPVTYFPSSQYYNSAAAGGKTRQQHQERINYSKGEQRVPYTMLVPPPMPSASRPQEMRPFKQQPIPTLMTTTPAVPTSTPLANASSDANSSVSVQESKLVYQSSSLSVADEWQQSLPKESAPSSTSHVPVVWNSTVQKNKASPIPLVLAPESYILKERYPPKPHENSISISEVFEDSVGSASTSVQSSGEPPMRKGHVTDESMDISNTYVNIGKPDAQIQASNMEQDTTMRSVPPPQEMPMTLQLMHSMQSMQTMETMQPPPMLQPMQPPTMHLHAHNFSKPPSMMKPAPPKPMPASLYALLQKEITPSAQITTFRPLSVPNIVSTTMPATTTTTPPPPTTLATTTQAPLTTDTLFKHYKQPIEPLKGPMYLIIQGHSKVKTYGPSKSVHGIQVQETNEIPTAEEDQKGLGRLSAYSLQDHLNSFSSIGLMDDVKTREGKELDEPKENVDIKNETERRGRSHGGLHTLNHAVQAGLGAIGVPLDRKNDNAEEIEYADKEIDKTPIEPETEDEELRKGKEIERDVKRNGLYTLLHVVQSGMGAINVPLDSKEQEEEAESLKNGNIQRRGREEEIAEDDKSSKLLESLTFNFQEDSKDAKSEQGPNATSSESLEKGNRQERSRRLQTLEVPSKGEESSARRGEAVVPLERKDEDVQETEFVVRYDVSRGKGEENSPTSERYFKGIVEAGDMSRKLH